MTKLSNLDITSSYNDNAISGVVSGSTPITYRGADAGQLTLSANNSFTGAVNVASGILAITHNNALGSPSGSTTVASDAALHVSNNITVPEAITISGSGISSNGVMRNVSDTNTLSGLITLAADSEIQINADSTLTLNNAASGANAITGTYNLTIDSLGTSNIADPVAISTGNLTKAGTGTLTLSAANTYTGDTTISAGTMKLTGTLNSATDLSIASSATLDLQNTQTVATLDLEGTISNTANTSSLTVSGTADLGGNVTTTGTQTYTGNVTLSNDVTLTTTDSNITFNGTINSDGDTARAFTIDLDANDDGTTADVIFGNDSADTLGATKALGAISITADMDLNAAITNAASLSVSGTSNLGANVTTSGNQTYTGAVTLSNDVTLTTTDSNITFGSTLRSDDAESPRDLTINLDANEDGTTADLMVNGVIGGSSLPLDVITITGDLDLNASIGNSPGATSLTVSGATDLGANVETTGTQTYTGNVTLSADVTLTTTDSNITFNGTINSCLLYTSPSPRDS